MPKSMINQQIRILDEKTINQIAAGEVIENAASVIKELVENSLDAGATEISIETHAAGRAEIKVSDNGYGMRKDQLLLSIERHATSKLSNSEELNSLLTMGFRGEALPSISSIAKLSITSCPDDSGKAALLQMIGGKCIGISETSRQQGTTVEVKSLFFNVPVRRKFQKSLSSEGAIIHKLFTQLCLCNTEISFIWLSEGKELFHIDKENSLLDRAQLLLGKEFANKLLPVEHTKDQISCFGYFGHPSYHRPNRGGQWLFINRRPVSSPFISKRILESYGTRLSTHRYPVFILHLHMPPHWIDVNVHPQKKEIRLRNEEYISDFLIEAVDCAFASKLKLEKISPSGIEAYFPSERLYTNDQRNRFLNAPDIPDFESACSAQFSEVGELQRRKADPNFEHLLCQNSDSSGRLSIVSESIVEYQPQTLAPSPKERPIVELPKLIYRLKHFLFVEDATGLRIVNGKRARARIVYEKVLSSKNEKAIQALLIPINLECSFEEASLLQEQIEKLNGWGIGVRHFGGNTFIIDEIPSAMEITKVKEMIRHLLDDPHINLERILERSLKYEGRYLENGAQLLFQLSQCKDPSESPDGKSISQPLTEKSLNRLFMHK